MNYNDYLSKRAIELPPSGIRKFFDVVSEMKDAISLGVGEPDFVTPWGIRDAAIKSIQKGFTQYTSNWGMKELRTEICKYLKRFDLSYNEKEVLVSVGASEAIDVALRSLINDGDEVLVPDPSYVSYAPCITLCGGVARAIPTSAEKEFKLMPQDIESVITKKTKAIIIPYPNNPTGAIMTSEELQAIVEVIIRHDLIVISDEIYAELTYGIKHTSIASLPNMKERTLLINGFSKAFAMTGWRIGYIAAPEEIINVIVKIHQYAIMCAPTCSQYAALHALKSGYEENYEVVNEMKEDYDMRRRFLITELRRAGLQCFEPKGAFYAFPSVKELGVTGAEFSEGLLKSKKIAVVPGEAFGASGKYHIRCCYAASIKNLQIAVSRISEYVEELKSGK